MLLSHNGFRKHALTGMLILLVALQSLNGYAQINQFNTPDLRLIYLGKGYYYMVPHMARCYENAMQFQKNFWHYTPSEEVTILLNDFADIGNGGTLVLPWNMVTLGISPFSFAYNIVPTNERFQWLMNHELTHTVMCDKAARGDVVWRKIFGGKVMADNANPMSMMYSYLTTPRWYSPRWYHEGIAVFMETWMSGGLGRVLGGYDEMVFRTMVYDSSYFYNVIGLETEGSTIDFQVGANAYLYGTRFVSYLAYKYGVEKLREFYSRTDSSRAFYANQFKHVYGIRVQDEWDKWIKWEHEFQTRNLDTIRVYPLTPVVKVTAKPLGSVSNAFVNMKERKIYAAVNYPGKAAHIASIDLDNGEMKKIAEVPSPVLYYVTSLTYDEADQKLFMSVHNNDWRGLKSVDVRTGRTKNLIKLTRAGDFAFDKKDKSIWAIQHSSARVTLIQIPPPYDKYNEVYTIEFGKSFFDIAISNNGEYLAGIMSDIKGNQQLVLFRIDDLLQGKANFEKIYEFEENVMSSFVFSPDDRYLIGSSYYTGVSNIYRINIETKQSELLSNAETGFFRPIPLGEDSLLVFQYHHDGLLPCKIKLQPIEDAKPITYLGQLVYETNPVVEDWMLKPPSRINIDSMKTFEGKYHSFTELRFASAFPVIEGYKDLFAYGYRFNFMDPVGLHTLKLTATYTPYGFLPDNQKFHINLDYHYWNWQLRASWNKTDFYDLFGPTKVSRAGYAVVLKYQRILKRFKPQMLDFFVQMGAYGGLERLPEYQNVQAPYTELYTGLASVHYSNLRKSLGAVEPEQGFEWNFYFNNYLANGTIYPSIITNQDFGFLLPLRNTSLWLRTSLGNSFGERKNALSNFYFGGFRNNWIDYRPPQHYREFESFPGVAIDDLPAMDYGKLLTEVNFDPIRFRKLGFLSFYSTYARFSVFGMGLWADPTYSDYKYEVYNAGAQLDFELVLFSLIKSTLSFGYARAFEKGFLPKDQYMVSLKLL
jgi:6-phosphogluconolactonase (cycloisomerase 2 family)